MSDHLRSVMPLDVGPRREETAVRNVCWKCAVRWWTSAGDADKCPQCSASFKERDAWKAQPFQPEHLTQARELAMLTIDELASKTAMPIADFESGAQVPSIGQMVQLARIVKHVLPAFFTMPPSDVEIGHIFFCNTSTYCDYDECPNLMEAFCDYPRAGGGTCDRKICGDHGKRVGDDVDYCLDCVKKEPAEAMA